MLRVFVSVVLVSSCLLLGGCASDQSQTLSPTGQYSTIPWNQPQPGEGSLMGGMMNSH